MDAPDYPVASALQVFRNVAKDFDAVLESSNTPDKEILERFFSAVSLVLRAYCRPANFREDGTPREHLPQVFIEKIANQVDYIRQGFLPSPIKEMIRQGAPGIGPHEHKDIQLAVAYIHAVRDGLVKDRHPVKTITEFYGVTDRAVRGWQKSHPNAEASDLFWDADDAELATLLCYAMKKAGLRYKQVGRGSKGRVQFPRPGKRQMGP